MILTQLLQQLDEVEDYILNQIFFMSILLRKIKLTHKQKYISKIKPRKPRGIFKKMQLMKRGSEPKPLQSTMF